MRQNARQLLGLRLLETDPVMRFASCGPRLLSLNMKQWRYSGKSLFISKMELVVEYAGTQMGSKLQQGMKLQGYVFRFGTLPPGNKTTW